MANSISRRSLLKTTSAAAAFSIVKPHLVRGAGKETVKVGLVGCGGRGTSAVFELMAATENAELTAMADVFEDKLEGSLRRLREEPDRLKRYVGQTVMRDGKPHQLTMEELQKKMATNIKVAPDHRFVGQDAFKRLLATDIDAVLLITPPGHRPLHFEAAVEANKHVFLEKPIATDPVGVRRVMAAGEKARELGLTVVSGTEMRYTPRYIETVERLHAGAIGDIVATYAYWYGNAIFHATERKPGWSEIDWQHRNWYSFIWICGDQLVEQQVHRIDLLDWIMQAHPVKAIGNGGRAWRQDDNPLHGDVFDIMDVEFTYPNGVKLMSMSRHYPRHDHLPIRNGAEVAGAKGRSDCQDLARTETPTIGGMEEQSRLVNSIRGDGPYLNDTEQVCECTMVCIMGREAAYSGQEVTWDQVMQSKLDLYPKDLSPGATIPVPKPPVPGEYRFV